MWAREAAQRAVWEQQGVQWFHLFLGSLKNLTMAGDEGGRRGGCGPGRRARGRRWGGGTREQCGSNKAFWAPLKT